MTELWWANKAKRVRLPKTERESFWRRQINDWTQGGQTIAAFCRERGLTESALLVAVTRRPKTGTGK